MLNLQDNKFRMRDSVTIVQHCYNFGQPTTSLFLGFTVAIKLTSHNISAQKSVCRCNQNTSWSSF